MTFKFMNARCGRQITITTPPDSILWSISEASHSILFVAVGPDRMAALANTEGGGGAIAHTTPDSEVSQFSSTQPADIHIKRIPSWRRSEATNLSDGRGSGDGRSDSERHNARVPATVAPQATEGSSSGSGSDSGGLQDLVVDTEVTVPASGSAFAPPAPRKSGEPLPGPIPTSPIPTSHSPGSASIGISGHTSDADGIAGSTTTTTLVDVGSISHAAAKEPAQRAYRLMALISNAKRGGLLTKGTDEDSATASRGLPATWSWSSAEEVTPPTVSASGARGPVPLAGGSVRWSSWTSLAAAAEDVGGAAFQAARAVARSMRWRRRTPVGGAGGTPVGGADEVAATQSQVAPDLPWA